MNKKLLLNTFRNTFGALVYIFLVSQIMQNGSKLFGETDNMITPFVILLLFSLSAAVLSGLVFGHSLFHFFENKKEDSIKSAIYSIGWLGFYTALVFVVLFLTK